MADQISYSDYWIEVASLAKRITEEAVERGGRFDESLEEALHETVDGHGWVIYTWQAQQVLAYSPNDSVALTEGLYEPKAGEPLNWSAMAYGALEADVREHSAFGVRPDDSEE